MRVVIPTIELAVGRSRLAQRPDSLNGKRLGIYDGWGDGRPDMGPDTMYPLLRALADLVRSESEPAETVYVRKGTILGVPPQQVAEFAMGVDVVLNGEGI